MKKYFIGFLSLISVSAFAEVKTVVITKVASQTMAPTSASGITSSWGDGYGHIADVIEMKTLIAKIAQQRAEDECTELNGKVTFPACDTQVSGEDGGFTVASACSVSCVI